MNTKPMNLDNVSVVILDVDGTWYDKDKEYNKGKGTIDDAHDFFAYTAWDMIQNKKVDPYLTAAFLRAKYKKISKIDGELRKAVLAVDSVVWDFSIQYGYNQSSRGKTFDNMFDLNNPNYLHEEMLQHIDFNSVLSKDQQLTKVFDEIDGNGFHLGILTTETYKTVEKIANVMGVDLKKFHMNTGNEYPILCAENVKNKKPDSEGFLKAMEIYGIKDPSNILYVGDSFPKDVQAPLLLGMQAIHVQKSYRPGEENIIETEIMEHEGTKFEYKRIGNIHDLADVILCD